MNTDYKIIRLRCIAIITVVLGHSIIIYDPQWTLYHTNNEVELLMWAKRVINVFQMPLFLFLSGLCFFYSVQKNNYNCIKNVVCGVIEKSKRLIIPFFFVSVLYLIPIRKLCHYVAWDNMSYYQMLKNVLLGVDCGHLWFLPTLFSIFIIAFVVVLFNATSIDVCFLGLSVVLLLFADSLPFVYFVNYIAKSMYWFFVGYVWGKYKDNRGVFRRTKDSLRGLVISVVLVLLTAYPEIDSMVVKITQISAVTIMMLTSYQCISNRECSRGCKLISDDSMGVYLLHSPLIYFTFDNFPNGMPVVVVFVNFVIGGSIALLLAHFLKNSVAKGLLGY